MNEKIPETLILIQGEPEYELIDACWGLQPFWYSPAAKKEIRPYYPMTITASPIPYPEMGTVSAPMGIK